MAPVQPGFQGVAVLGDHAALASLVDEEEGPAVGHEDAQDPAVEELRQIAESRLGLEQEVLAEGLRLLGGRRRRLGHGRERGRRLLHGAAGQQGEDRDKGQKQGERKGAHDLLREAWAARPVQSAPPCYRHTLRNATPNSAPGDA